MEHKLHDSRDCACLMFFGIVLGVGHGNGSIKILGTKGVRGNSKAEAAFLTQITLTTAQIQVEREGLRLWKMEQMVRSCLRSRPNQQPRESFQVEGLWGWLRAGVAGKASGSGYLWLGSEERTGGHCRSV